MSNALKTFDRATYLSPMGGKIVRRVPKDTPNAESRQNKNGDTVYELKYDAIEGVITNIKVKESTDYGKSWQLKIENAGENYILDMSYSSAHAKSFLMRMPNIDFGSPVEFQPYAFEDENGRNRSGFVIRQSQKKVEPFWTKDNPGDLPKMSIIKVKGKDTWDDSDQLEYLEAYIQSNVTPKLGIRTVKEKAPLKAIRPQENFDNVPTASIEDLEAVSEPAPAPVAQETSIKEKIKSDKLKQAAAAADSDDDDLPF